jgi:hypothetical protein
MADLEAQPFNVDAPDVEAGKPVELDALVSVVRGSAGRRRADTLTDALLGLARLHARLKGLYRRSLYSAA